MGLDAFGIRGPRRRSHWSAPLEEPTQRDIEHAVAITFREQRVLPREHLGVCLTGNERLRYEEIHARKVKHGKELV